MLLAGNSKRELSDPSIPFLLIIWDGYCTKLGKQTVHNDDISSPPLNGLKSQNQKPPKVLEWPNQSPDLN